MAIFPMGSWSCFPRGKPAATVVLPSLDSWLAWRMQHFCVTTPPAVRPTLFFYDRWIQDLLRAHKFGCVLYTHEWGGQVHVYITSLHNSWLGGTKPPAVHSCPTRGSNPEDLLIWILRHLTALSYAPPPLCNEQGSFRSGNTGKVRENQKTFSSH